MIWYILGDLISICLWIWLCVSDDKITRGDLFWAIPIGLSSWFFCLLFGIVTLYYCFEDNLDKIKTWFNYIIWRRK